MSNFSLFFFFFAITYFYGSFSMWYILGHTLIYTSLCSAKRSSWTKQKGMGRGMSSRAQAFVSCFGCIFFIKSNCWYAFAFIFLAFLLLMTGFLFDPVYKLPKIENNPNFSALGRRIKPYKDIRQLIWRASDMDKCGMKEDLVEKKEKVTRLPQKTLVYTIFLTHSLRLGRRGRIVYIGK